MALFEQGMVLLKEYQPNQGRIVFDVPGFDIDDFARLASDIVQLLSATVLETQMDADIQTWLIDFEGCHLFLKAEHYTSSVWLESVAREHSRDELNYLAGLFKSLN
ncbi:DUF3630 family protein [Vibrio sp. SM6]|uniref:DUF3630 family protein n=1 Tax=Vibrio agarilyticus TaxID=2726741 RepID=A0A7X8TTT3_9VIBR|nr:DUF3630 family protein [Vibrio agarilyticus]NLS14780.1 DUF3630 family protein [Vibrio agarilyticus]